MCRGKRSGTDSSPAGYQRKSKKDTKRRRRQNSISDLHGDFSKLGKVALQDSSFHFLHSARNNVLPSVLQRKKMSDKRVEKRRKEIAKTFTRRKSLVSTEVFMPDVDDVPFFLSLATNRMACISGQCDSGATCTAMLSSPSLLDPISHFTYPPYILRHALPLPSRAITESSPGRLSCTWNAWARVYAGIRAQRNT